MIYVLRITWKKAWFRYISFGIVLAALPFLPGMSSSNATLLGNVVYFSIAALGFQVLLG